MTGIQMLSKRHNKTAVKKQRRKVGKAAVKSVSAKDRQKDKQRESQF